MFLQVYFFIVSIYGWLTWKNQRQTNKPISRLTPNKRLVILLVIFLTTILLGFLVKDIHLLFPKVFPHPASFPFIDTFIAISSIIATILLAKRIIENWVLWIVVDIVCVFIYAKKNILFISFEYGVFFLLASFGLFAWAKTIVNDKRIYIR
jgi:nicotinamide mononucleotide transporter